MSTTVEQVSTDLGRPLTDTEALQVTQWIGDAELQIRARFSPLTLADLDQEALEYVVRMAVVGKVRRPDPVTQVDVAVDDGRVSRRYESATGQVTILDEWWALLTPATLVGPRGAFSIRPAFTPDRVGWPW